MWKGIVAIGIIAIGIGMGACATQPYVETDEPTTPTEDSPAGGGGAAPAEGTDAATVEATTGAGAAETQPAPGGGGAAGPAAPVRTEFTSEDGTPLVGTFYPPASGPAPGVLLMHQNRGNRDAWRPLIDALRANPRTAGFAIFAFDFPGHGESGGSLTEAAALAAARSALAQFRTFEGVDPNKIAMVGASIGADAAVDACGEGCVAAVSVSPGGFLGVPYNEALAALLADKDPPVLCIAASGDATSPATCQGGESVGLSDYEVKVYDGEAHGNALFFVANLTPPPPITDLVVGWLADHLGS